MMKSKIDKYEKLEQESSFLEALPKHERAICALCTGAVSVVSGCARVVSRRLCRVVRASRGLDSFRTRHEPLGRLVLVQLPLPSHASSAPSCAQCNFACAVLCLCVVKTTVVATTRRSGYRPASAGR